MKDGDRIACRRRLGVAKVLAVSVPVVVSFFGWWAVIAVLPPVAQVWALIAVVLSVGVAILPAAEPVVVRLLYRGRPATTADAQILSATTSLLCGQGWGPPLVRFYVGPPGSHVAAQGVGRRSVVIMPGLLDALVSARITPEQAAVAIAPTTALVRAGATRTDIAILIWVLPWTVVRAVGTVLVRVAGLTGLLRLGWRTRWFLAAVAAVQAVQASRPAWALVLAVILAVTYAWPRWVAAWQALLVEVGAAAAAQVGADVRTPHTGATPDRPQRAEPPLPHTDSDAPARGVDGRPRLTLVR